MSIAFQPTSFHDHDAPAPARASWLASTQRSLEPLLAWPISALLGAVFQSPEAWCMGRVDQSTGLYNRAGLLAYGGAMQDKARRERKPLAIAVFDFEDLLEVREIYGATIYQQVLDHVVVKLRTLAGPRGLCARTGKAQFTVLLQGCGRDRVLRAVQRVLGSPTRIELDTGEDEIVLVPDFQFESGCGDEPIGELYKEICRDLLKQRENEHRRRHYLQRERERHSRPSPLVTAH
jgi:GGDEF domain-containing protein